MSAKTESVSIDNPTAVIVDTNAFHQGRLTRGAITSLKSLTALGLHVIVPDVVCRELASHAWQDYVQAQELLALTDTDVVRLNQPQKIYDTFAASVEATGATVGVSNHNFLRDGLHAQILRTAPASPKGEVTTGAVDYIVYLHALAATNRYATVAVITSDKLLRTALAARPGIQIFQDFSSVRKGDVSHMRLPLKDALSPLSHLLSKEFERAMSENMDPADPRPLTLVGVGDILRLNDSKIVAYVDVSAASFVGANAEYLGHDIDRWQVTLGEPDFVVDSIKLISTDNVSTWPPHITPIEEYLSTELSMVPSIIRPVPEDEFINDTKTPVTFTSIPTPQGGKKWYASSVKAVLDTYTEAV